jgi:hypothetical protein
VADELETEDDQVLDSDLALGFEAVPPGRVDHIAHDATASVVQNRLVGR